MGSVICQLAANDNNSQIAVCTADNGVHFVGTDNEVLNTLQDFTYMENDKTGNCKFPVGLRLNPRTNTLVLNGKHGHLQFYSVYTKTMLYNVSTAIYIVTNISLINLYLLTDGHCNAKYTFYGDW